MGRGMPGRGCPGEGGAAQERGREGEKDKTGLQGCHSMQESRKHTEEDGREGPLGCLLAAPILRFPARTEGSDETRMSPCKAGRGRRRRRRGEGEKRRNRGKDAFADLGRGRACRNGDAQDKQIHPGMLPAALLWREIVLPACLRWAAPGLFSLVEGGGCLLSPWGYWDGCAPGIKINLVVEREGVEGVCWVPGG